VGRSIYPVDGATPELSDEELLAEARRETGPRREALVNELFRPALRAVARWCLRFTGERESAADLAQKCS
jgi:DNA-directed RNA polymerase specialized sigma24 family protein